MQGAPNFRAPDEEGLNVYGVAQPTVPGLKSILTILACQPYRPEVDGDTRRRGSLTVPEQSQCIWFSTREETLGECDGDGAWRGVV